MLSPDLVADQKGSFADRLNDALRAPDPEALEALWLTLSDEVAQDERRIAADVSRFLDHEETASGSVVGVREALGIGVVSARGALECGDGLIRSCLDEPQSDPALRSLLHRARSKGSATGLLTAPDDAVVTAWAGTLAAARDRWPLSPEALSLLGAGLGRSVVVVYAPTRSGRLTAGATAAFGFSPLQVKLAEALLVTPTLQAAADCIGLSRASARGLLEGMCAKAGVRRSTELVKRLVDLMCASPEGAPEQGEVAETLGLTPSEARAASALAAGLTASDAAQLLGLRAETVRGYARTILAKTGVRRTKDLARLLVEARELKTLADADDVTFQAHPDQGRVRIIARAAGRKVAFRDYGPPNGRPVIAMHGSASGGELPPVFVRALQSGGLRPLVVQRPGFGLTDPCVGDYLDSAADDLVGLMDALRLAEPILLAREGSVAVAVRLAEQRPDRVGRVVLVNPRTPIHLAREPTFPLASAARHLLGNPMLVGPVSEFVRRRNTRARIERLVWLSCAASPSDQAFLASANVMDWLVRDIQALTARSVSGFVAEFRVWAEGWTLPPVAGGRWTIVRPGDLPLEMADAYASLPHASVVRLADAGFLTWFTHPEQLTELLLKP